MSEHALAQQQSTNTPQEKTTETFSFQRQKSNQAKPTVLQHEGLFDEACRTFVEPRFGYDFSLVPAHADMTQQVQPSLRTGTMVQRYPINEDTDSASCATYSDEESAPISASAEPTAEPAPSTPEATPTPATPESEEESAAAEETSAPALLVEDSVTELAPGQMRKSEFLSQLRAAVTAEAESAMAGTGRTTADCPYLDYWFDYYNAQDAQHDERALRRYAPEVSSATSAREYIPIVAARVRQSVETWVRTGEVTGVPEGVSADLPGETSTGRGGSSPTSGGPVMAKARDGGIRSADNPRAIQTRLGQGRPLESSVRSRMESAFSKDFSHVRTHTDTTAVGLSSRLNARAFTVGEHIAFGAGEYKPGTLFGDALIAHEMAHVVQQSGAGGSVAAMRTGDAGYNTLEKDADKSAIGIIASLWTGAKDTLSDIAQNAIPRLRSGLCLSRCKSGNPTLSLSGDSYTDTATESHKKIYFNVAVPPGVNSRDYALVNKLKGFEREAPGKFFKVKMYGSIVDFNFPSWQVDSVDPDPVYWSEPGSRWNYDIVSGGFNAYDDPGPALSSEHGALYAVKFKIGLYKLSDLPATTSGTIGATPIEEKPWQYSVVVDSTGAFTHPTL